MRVFVTEAKFQVGDGPGDTDGNSSFGLWITVYDTALKRILSTIARITNAQLVSVASQATFSTQKTTFINNAVIAAYAAQGITITAVDIVIV